MLMRNKFVKTFMLFSIFSCTVLFAGTSFLQVKPISQIKLKMYPKPHDYRNYFFLQSIGNTTSVIIGDFTGTERMIVNIIDYNADNTIDKVIEYYPDSNKFKYPGKRSASQFFTSDLKAFKQSIINGKVFRENYAYKLKSIQTVFDIFKRGENIIKDKHGWRVSYTNPDSPGDVMSEFFFGKKKDGKQVVRYDLSFKRLIANIHVSLTKLLSGLSA